MNLFEWFAAFVVLGFISAFICAFYKWVLVDTNDIKGEDKR